MRSAGFRLLSQMRIKFWKNSGFVQREIRPIWGRLYSAAATGKEKPENTAPFNADLHWESEKDENYNIKNTENTENMGDSRFASHGAESSQPHIPVMCREVMDCFWRLDNLGEKSPTFLDMTFGAGGHSAALLETFPDCKIFALDRDPLAKEYMNVLQERFPDRLFPLFGKFTDLPNLLKQCGMKEQFDGILLDAGCSSMQMDEGGRGFSFSKPESLLDMRMDGQKSENFLTAADVVNRMNEESLGEIFRKYGDEKHSKKIARAIVENRFMMKKFTTTGDLADLVVGVVSADRSDRLNRKQHPATKVFQALRIFVNDELNELDYALTIGHRFLRSRGIFVSITFHSLECKIVKEHFHSADWRDRLLHNPENPQMARMYHNYARFLPKEDVLDAMQFRWMLLHKKAIQPSNEEMEFNPRCRSAKLRAALKLTV